MAVHHTKKSSFTHWWVVHWERMCRLTRLCGSSKDTVKAYTPVIYSTGCNVALLLIHSMRIGKDLERTAALIESVRRIQRQIKPWPDLDKGNDATVNSSGAVEVIRCWICSPSSPRTKKTCSEDLVRDNFNPMDADVHC